MSLGAVERLQYLMRSSRIVAAPFAHRFRLHRRTTEEAPKLEENTNDLNLQGERQLQDVKNAPLTRKFQ